MNRICSIVFSMSVSYISILKAILLCSLLLTVSTSSTYAQFKKDGTPDMRFSSNKQLYGGIKSSKSISSYNNTTYQRAYTKKNGGFVQPHIKTKSNKTNLDNFSTKDNINNYTNKKGYRAKDFSNESLNYGTGYEIKTGSRGGKYYRNSNGNKVYVPKRNNY